MAKGKIVEVNTLLPEVDAILQGVFPNAENDNQDAILLRVDPESLQRSRMGTISGQVYLQTDAGGFPEVGWDDIVVPVLYAWLNAVNFVSASSRAQVVHFMDGPFRVELKHASRGMIALLLVEDGGDGNRQEFFASTNTLRRNACEAADSNPNQVPPTCLVRSRHRSTCSASKSDIVVRSRGKGRGC
ncbi:MAG TPA: hypothetical protein VNH18_12890 [Bryobacteraceae bacterium]|nr:hypothetical protein [Bryobacteraceae bacterium]